METSFVNYLILEIILTMLNILQIVSNHLK